MDLTQEYIEKVAKIGSFLTSRNERIAAAESCTGGLISAAFTHIPGSSAWFWGAVVAYDNSIKQNVLGVSNKTLQEFGAVSPQTIEEMLEGTLNLFKTEWAVAVSGIAGPGGATCDKPVGTVFIGVLRKGETAQISHNLFSGNREEIRCQTVYKAIDMLLSYFLSIS